MRKEDREYASLHYAQGEGRGRQGSGRLSRGVYSAAPRRSGTFSAEAATLGTRELNDIGKTPEVIRTAPVMPVMLIRPKAVIIRDRHFIRALSRLVGQMRRNACPLPSFSQNNRARIESLGAQSLSTRESERAN